MRKAPLGARCRPNESTRRPSPGRSQTARPVSLAATSSSVLEENRAELAQAMQDAFEDAVLMGVDETAMRDILAGMVAGLASPKRRP